MAALLQLPSALAHKRCAVRAATLLRRSLHFVTIFHPESPANDRQEQRTVCTVLLIDRLSLVRTRIIAQSSHILEIY